MLRAAIVSSLLLTFAVTATAAPVLRSYPPLPQRLPPVVRAVQPPPTVIRAPGPDLGTEGLPLYVWVVNQPPEPAPAAAPPPPAPAATATAPDTPAPPSGTGLTDEIKRLADYVGSVASSTGWLFFATVILALVAIAQAILFYLQLRLRRTT